MRKTYGSLLSVVALAALSASCGSAGGNGAGSSSVAKAVSNKPAGEANRVGSTMVAAVASGKMPGSVEVRFELSEKPEVGKPLKINVALIPVADLEGLFVRFQATDGLEVKDGAETERFTHPEKGVPISHTVTVVPKSDGVYVLTAMVLSDSETESVARGFSIPLITG